MKLCCISIFAILLSGSAAMGQNPLAELKFEDAEKYFNEGNYEKAIAYIDETEEMVGVTSKTLYLRIVSQDQLFSAAGDWNLLVDLRINAGAYMDAMKTQGLDDRFREVYRIHEKLKAYPESEAEFKDLADTYGSAGFGTVGRTAEVIRKYIAGRGGMAAISAVTSMVVELEEFVSDQLIARSVTKSAIGKFRKVEERNNMTNNVVYNKEKGIGYMDFGGNPSAGKGNASITPLPEQAIAEMDRRTANGLAMLELDNLATLQTAEIEAGEFNGERAMVITLDGVRLYCSSASGLLMGIRQNVVEDNIVTVVITTRYEDYREVKGIKFPFTTVVSKRFTEEAIQRMKENIQSNQAATINNHAIEVMGMLGGASRKSKKNKEMSALMNQAPDEDGVARQNKMMETMIRQMETDHVTKITSLKVNEHIPETDFE